VETPHTPAVSVIISAYQVTAYISETLDSVCAQSFRDYEIIVVNDGCPDTENLERVLAPYRSHLTYIQQPNAGPAAARNAGICIARAPLVATLDGDDLWHRDYLDVQVSMLAADSSVDVVYPDAIYFGNPSLEGRRFMEFCKSEGEVTFETLITQSCNVFTSVTARKSALVKAGLFDPEFRRSEDFDLWVRVVKSGGRIAYHRQALVRYRQRDDSLSANSSAMLRGALRVLDKFAATMDLSARELQVLERARRSFRARLDLSLAKEAFERRDTAAAIQGLRQANTFLKSPRLLLIATLLQICPGMLQKVYRARRK
jgi:glycosyltransferase involved in cell wall biosynthesis